MTTPYIVKVITCKKQNQLRGFQIAIKRFYENCMVLDLAKCHFLCLGKNIENETYIFNKTEMKNSSEEKILGIINLKINLSSKVM